MGLPISGLTNLVESALLAGAEGVEALDQKSPQFVPTGQKILNGIQNIFSPIIQKKYGTSANDFNTQFVSDQTAVNTFQGDVNTLQQGPAAINTALNSASSAIQGDPAFKSLLGSIQGRIATDLTGPQAVINNDFAPNSTVSPSQVLSDITLATSGLSDALNIIKNARVPFSSATITAVSDIQSQVSTQVTALTNVITPDAQLPTITDVINTYQGQLTAAQAAFAKDVAFFNALTPTEQELFVELYPGTKYPTSLV